MIDHSAISAIDREDMCVAVGCAGLWDRRYSTEIPLCIYHFHDAYMAVEAMMARAVEKIGAKPGTKTVLRRPKGEPVVYYVRMNENIKIGMTTSFHRRMAEFYAQPEDVLAIEPGGRALEKSRHEQFTPYRVGATELFRPNAILAELIEELRAVTPHPWITAELINHPPSYREVVPAD